MSLIKLSLLGVIMSAIVFLCSAAETNESVFQLSNKTASERFIGRMLEQGRTLVHHATKRFMIILPAIFFKLGVAFTLLVLVTIVAVNNGFIGFLLLIVGISSVLARLQEARRPPAPFPYAAPLPYFHHAQLLDRSDSLVERNAAEQQPQMHPRYQYYVNGRPYAQLRSQSQYSSKDS